MFDVFQQFREALIARGIVPPATIIADGKLHRCDAEGSAGKGDAAYLLHKDGIPAGGFQNWRDGKDWQNWRADVERELTTTEKAKYQQRVKDAIKQREMENAKRVKEAREYATTLWDEAISCISHPYLTRKGIGAHGVRQHQERLLIPVRDENGTLHSLQFIDPSGSKRFLMGGRTFGCFHLIGEPDKVLCVVEGFATGASIHEATGYAVAVAFCAGNLMSVATAAKKKYPGLQLILCADDDYHTDGNPGLTKAREAAKTVGGSLAVPNFGEKRPEGATDFSDLHRDQGREAVEKCIDETLDKYSADGGERITTWKYESGRFESSPKGLLFIATDKDRNDKTPRWICSQLTVVAMTRDAKNGAWGRLLEWHDADHVNHKWAMPLEMLQGDGLEVRRELARLGLSISQNKSARDLLMAFLQFFPVQVKARCVDRLGWHGSVYVTPSESIGRQDELVVFQNSQALEPAFAIAGTAEEWRDSVATLAAGNSRLVFALALAFAGPLLDVAAEDSGGFHLRGGSSCGKTTILKAAASVWGDPTNYPRAWRTTVNGLEGLAALHNDGLLILDEISQIDPSEAGDAAYLLANGQGKVRASKAGAARASARWRLLFLSAGEESLPCLMERVGKKTNAGQEIRLADIEVDAGAGLGAFEELHDHATPAVFALAITDAVSRFHGAVGKAWLEQLVENRSWLMDAIEHNIRQFVRDAVPVGADGQALRVARRFALVAVAGELATQYGLTGWDTGEVTKAVQQCFAVWMESFGGAGNREERAILSHVRAFFEAHGSGRFQEVRANLDQRVSNRAGFWRLDRSGAREFLVPTETFRREICAGFNVKTVKKVLSKVGWLAKSEEGRATQKPRIPELGTIRCYVFTEHMWASGDDEFRLPL